MANRTVTLSEPVGPHPANTSLVIDSVYGSHHVYDFKLCHPDNPMQTIEVVEDQLTESSVLDASK